jgi:hypothetical protein
MQRELGSGGLAERFKAPGLNPGDRKVRGFESHALLKMECIRAGEEPRWKWGARKG